MKATRYIIAIGFIGLFAFAACSKDSEAIETVQQRDLLLLTPLRMIPQKVAVFQLLSMMNGRGIL